MITITKRKAFELATLINNTCHEYTDECTTNCPFNFGGCLVSAGTVAPSDWKIDEILEEVANRK